MAITYSPLNIRGNDVSPIVGELLFRGTTLAKNYVTLLEDVKANTVFTEFTNAVTLQLFTGSGAPTSAGSTSIKDSVITPAKLEVYVEFNPETIRQSRFQKDMKAGAWNNISDEFQSAVLSQFVPLVASKLDQQFWVGITASAQTTIASMTMSATTNERTWAAAGTVPSYFNGVVAKLILDNTRTNVVATSSITSTNIFTEYARLYAAAPQLALNQPEAAVIFAPLSHAQLINIFNANETYRDKFSKENGIFYFNGLEIRFVQLEENQMILAIPSEINWVTDLASDYNEVKIDFIGPNRHDMFLNMIFTAEEYQYNKSFVTLYI